jgi:hypothetical protein
VSLVFEKPAGCSLDAQTLDVPVVSGGHPVTADDKSGVVADGAMTSDAKQVKVACRWRTSASGLAFDATIETGVGANQTYFAFENCVL